MAEESRFRGLPLFPDQRPCLDWCRRVGRNLHPLTSTRNRVSVSDSRIKTALLILCFAMSGTSLFSQSLVKERVETSLGLNVPSFESKLFLLQNFPEKISSTAARTPAFKPPLVFHFREPFFCRIEASLDKKVKMPLRFRLGSLDYVNSLERKPGY